MKLSIVIPARIGSIRLPGKMLLQINGKPLIWHVWNQVSMVRTDLEVIVATDSEEIYAALIKDGVTTIMTSPECQSGTERIASIIEKVDGELIINVQGNEPLIEPKMLEKLISVWDIDQFEMITPVFQIKTTDELFNENRVKVVRSQDGSAIYFSRQAIPFNRNELPENWLDKTVYWGHVGVYGYRRDVLDNYFSIPSSPLEDTEKLEQLRFLDAGYKIQTFETEYRSMSVDTMKDYLRVKDIIEERSA